MAKLKKVFTAIISIFFFYNQVDDIFIVAWVIARGIIFTQRRASENAHVNSYHSRINANTLTTFQSRDI